MCRCISGQDYNVQVTKHWLHEVHPIIYCIMQIVRGGKDSRLHDLLVIHGKTFVIVQQFETPYNKKEKNCWKTFAIGG